MEFGRILSRLRTRASLSQKQTADELKISQSTYNTWESEEISYKVKYLPKLAALFKVNMRDLLPPETDDSQESNRRAALNQQDEVLRLLRQANELLSNRVIDLEKQLAECRDNL